MIRYLIPGDGDCLYRACALYCLKSQSQKDRVRDDVYQHVRQNRRRFQEFHDGPNFDDRIEEIRKEKSWGSDLELKAMAEVYRTRFKVYQRQGATLTFEPERDASRTAFLWFSHGQHYDWLATEAELAERGLTLDANPEYDQWRQALEKEAAESRQAARELSGDGMKSRDEELAKGLEQALQAGIPEAEIQQQLAGRAPEKHTAPHGSGAGLEPRVEDEALAAALAAGLRVSEIQEQLGVGEPGPDAADEETALGISEALAAGVRQSEIERQI